MIRLSKLLSILTPLLFSLTFASLQAKATSHSIPTEVVDILQSRCITCHDANDPEAGINLNLTQIDWAKNHSGKTWEKVYNAVNHQQMPPSNRKQLSPTQRTQLLSYLNQQLIQHTPIGGTLPRRLNQLEYLNSIRTVFQMKGFKLPAGFPRDNRSHGFDTISEALVLSPPLLEAYQQVAQQIADEIFPPKKAKPPVTKWTANVDDLVLSFSAATIHGNALRLASRHNDIMRSSTWPSKIEITSSGSYRISIDASAFRPKDKQPMKLEVRAREIDASDRSRATTFRLLKIINITKQTPTTITFNADLYEGQTILLRWINAELNHDPDDFAALLEQKFFKDQRFLAAWQELIFPGNPRKPVSTAPLRGRNGWEILQKHYNNPNLNLADAQPDNQFTKRALEVASQMGNAHALADTLTYHYHENGPALQIHQVTVEGPFKLVDGPRDLQRRQWREWNFSTRRKDESNEAYADRALRTFLPRLFRRPVNDAVRQSYLNIAKQHWAAGHSFDEGMHLLLRNTLVSPRFLYRELSPGKLDSHDLANRVAFFLTRHPATSTIVHQARSGELNNPTIYRSTIEELLPKSPSAPMVRDFTEQWLDTRLLPEIMPDEIFGFGNEEINLAKAEVQHFFHIMLKENRPLRDFIDPDFITTSKRFAIEHYNLKIPGEKRINPKATYTTEHRKIERLPIPRGGVRGGLLGQSAVLMATSNGVDTQPVLRGVWVLNNLLGIPLPPPPTNVPALTPDTQGAKTPRDILDAHTKAAECRSCHMQIDPIGFVLENFDPVGGWRELWPKSNIPIDTTTVLPDGTPITTYTDFKLWLTNHIDIFAECLSQKLLCYATGRVLSHAEKHEIKQIVAKIQQQQGGFRDLLLALMESKTFKTR